MTKPGARGSDVSAASSTTSAPGSPWSKFIGNLANINSLNVLSGLTPTDRDVEAVVTTVDANNAPIQIVDLARKLAWDPDRVARAVSSASDRGRVTLSRIKDQTFVSLPAGLSSSY